MTNDSIEKRLTQVFEKLHAPLSEGLEKRTVSAMVASPPARLSPRVRMVAIAAGAVAAVLLVLGLFPFSTQSLEPAEAFARIYAAAARADTLHIIARSWGGEHESEIEIWASSEGIYRSESYTDGVLSHLFLQTPTRYMTYSPPVLREYESPALSSEEVMERALWQSFGTYEAIEKSLSYWEDASISVRREQSLSGEAYDVVEVEYETSWHPSTGGTLARTIATLESKSGRLVSLERYVLLDKNWKKTYETEVVEWDVALPVEVATFEPPPGTTVRSSDWWRRTDATHMKGETKDWFVALHAIDVNHSGDIHLTMSWVTKPQVAPEGFSGPGPKVQIANTTGVSYEQAEEASCITRPRGSGEECFWLIKMLRQEGAVSLDLPRTVAITVEPTPERTPGQTVTFSGVSLPPRQEAEDLHQPVVTQY